MAVGDIFQGGITSRVDAESGYTVYQPVAEDQNRHMYFTSNPFTRHGTELVFSGVRNGVENFYLLNYMTGEYKQLTDMEGLSISTAHYDKVRDTLYFSRENALYSVHVRTLETRQVFESPLPIGSLGITCDGKYLLTAVEGVKEMRNNDKEVLRVPMWRLVRVDLETGEAVTILIRSFKIDHIQCNPTDPDMIMYSGWGYYCTHQRIWYCSLDGSRGGPLGPEMPNEHRTHEYFTADGQRVAYHGKFFQIGDDFSFKNIRHTYGIMNRDGTGDRWYTCLPLGKQAGHSIISHNGRLIAADGDDWISFVRLSEADQTATFEPVIRHQSTMRGNFVHPHPSFSPDDRFILYATDHGGEDQGNIYLVDLKSK